MNFAKSAAALACVLSLGMAATQGAVAETTNSAGSGPAAKSRAVVWKSESFKAVVKDFDGGGTQRCLLWLRKPYRPVGGPKVIAKAKITCYEGRIGATGRAAFSIGQGPGCGKQTHGGFRTTKWRPRAGRWVYSLKLTCRDRPGIHRYSDSIIVSDQIHPGEDWDAGLVHRSRA
jgi:hypothetical protein